MKKIISTSFFRHSASEYESPEAGEARGKFFVNYLRSFVRAHTRVFPDWEWRIHHDERVTEFDYWKVVKEFERAGLCKLVAMGSAKYLTGSMLWRLLPCWDKGVDIVAFRDLDHLPTPRERMAVERWIKSGKFAHAIHDSESHGSVLFMGGMTALRTPVPWKSFDVIKQAFWNDRLNTKGADQHVLNVLLADYRRNGNYVLDTTKTMPVDDPLDMCDGNARHVGGAFLVEPVVKFYDENGLTDLRVLEIENENRGH